MAQKTMLIIGAGVAGLCAGIYGQMNGYQTRIVEQHTIPGGLVTAYRRKGYLIDLCIHWLAGSGPGFFLHRYWQEVGLLEGRQFLQHDRYGTYYACDGRVVHFYCDPERFENHWLELSPQDAQIIHELADGIRLGIRFRPPEKEKYEASILEWGKFIFSMMPLLNGIQKWSKMTVGDLAARFQSPLLRQALLDLFEPDFSVFYMILSQMGFMYRNQAAYPIGGSLPMALALEKRYKQLGGQVQYQARVEKILVENGRAVGVRLEDGGDVRQESVRQGAARQESARQESRCSSTELRADVIIAAGDGFTALFKLLDGEFIDQEIRDRFQNWQIFRSMIYIGLGVKRSFPDFPYSVEGNAFELPEPVMIAGEEHRMLPIRIRNEDPSFAPVGKTVLTSAIFTNYEFWRSLEGDRAAYEAEKENVARAYIHALEQIFPGIAGDIDMVNVASPLTFERITRNWKGSITGWKLTPAQAPAKISNRLKGLENFWMVGHWLVPGGGLPAGVTTAREVIWQQCRKDGKPFHCSKIIEAMGS